MGSNDVLVGLEWFPIRRHHSVWLFGLETYDSVRTGSFITLNIHLPLTKAIR
jgi:hypothetical protein